MVAEVCGAVLFTKISYLVQRAHGCRGGWSRIIKQRYHTWYREPMVAEVGGAVLLNKDFLPVAWRPWMQRWEEP